MSQPSPRFTLFLKIVSGYVVIVLSMAGGSLLILQEWRSLFTSNQSEFQVIQLLQSMTSSLEAEQKTTATILGTRDTVRMRLFHLFHRQFDEYGDSLRSSVDEGISSDDSIRSCMPHIHLSSTTSACLPGQKFDRSPSDDWTDLSRHKRRRRPPRARSPPSGALAKQRRGVVNSTAYAIRRFLFFHRLHPPGST
jgi:hypothetical protein